MPNTVANLLTTALLDRSELRSSLHFNQISVPSCDIVLFVLSAWYLVLCFDASKWTKYQVPSTKHKDDPKRIRRTWFEPRQPRRISFARCPRHARRGIRRDPPFECLRNTARRK